MGRIRPSVFIGSSSEGIQIAKTIQVLLDDSCEITVWSQNVFGLNCGTLESLVSTSDNFDFAILILTADDMIISRDAMENAPRDNVLFELGLFMGSLGRERTFIIYDRSKKIRLPSDLAGVKFATFEPHASGNLQSALGAAATQIENQIQRLGLREKERLNQFTKATSNLDNTTQQMESLIKLLSRSRKVELEIISSQFGPLIDPEKLMQIKTDLEQLEKTLKMAK